jgi:hypothetical protein
VALARQRSLISDAHLVADPAALAPAVFDAYSLRSTVMHPVDGTEMCGLMLRGKFSEDHPIARGISDRGGLHVV